MKPEFLSLARVVRVPELPTQTHWTRILHCDIAGAGDAGPPSRFVPAREIDRHGSRADRVRRTNTAARAGHDTTQRANRPHTDESVDGGPRARPPRSPLRQAALLLAIYVAMYATVGLLVHVAHVLAGDVAAFVIPAARVTGDGTPAA